MTYNKNLARRLSEKGRMMARARWDNHVPDPGNLTEDDAYYRMLEDRRGVVVRAGCDYSADGVRPWCVRYAVRGRTDQFEGIYAGRVVRRGGMRVVDTVLKRRRV